MSHHDNQHYKVNHNNKFFHELTNPWDKDSPDSMNNIADKMKKELATREMRDKIEKDKKMLEKIDVIYV